jgi:hypothetical protein
VLLSRLALVFYLVLCFIFANHAASKRASREYFSLHNSCEDEIAKAEKKYAIPHKLLMAIGVVESGQTTDSEQKRPFPWAICVEGKSYFFPTKNAAIAAVRKFKASGKKNIDVGCMQVNLLHHSHAFKTLGEAFTPKNNVDYAASFLVKLKSTHNSWTKAVGYYHSKSVKYYKAYCSAVYNIWINIRNMTINDSSKGQHMFFELKPKTTLLSHYCLLIDNKISKKLHQLGRRTISRSTPKFFTDDVR